MKCLRDKKTEIYGMTPILFDSMWAIFTMGSLRHTYAPIMVFNNHLDVANL